MARKVRSSPLENRTQRLKLPLAKKPVFVRIGPGVSLGYRRNQTTGSWVLKIADGKGGARTKAIGYADDNDEADGAQVYNFWQAQEKAKAEAKRASGTSAAEPLTVLKAAETYLVTLTAKNARTAADTKGRLNKHFLPQFGRKLVTSLTKTMLDGWLASMAIKSNDPEKVRRSKDSANRVLTMVKAFLNHAMKDPVNGLSDDSAWRFVKPFKEVAKPRDIRFTDDEVKRLIKSAPDQAVSNLIAGAFLSGARFGELAQAKVRDFSLKSKTLRIDAGKTGCRTIILQESAMKFFSKLADKRSVEDFLFVRADGTQWKRSDQTRPIKLALAAANLPEEGSLYALRHTYISSAIEGGVPLNIIAENCGTSIRMIEKTYAKILAEKRREFIEKGAPSL